MNPQILMTVFPAVPAKWITTSPATLSANAAQLQPLDNRETLAFSIISLMYLLHSKGGTDYRTNHDQLRRDVTTFMGTFGLFDYPTGNGLLQKLSAAVDWNAAYGADTSIGTDVLAIIVNMAGIRETPEQVLWQYIIFLRYCLSILAI